MIRKMAKESWKIRAYSFLMLTLFLSSAASTQVTEQQVKSALARYERPNLRDICVRGFYPGNRIQYTENGVPVYQGNTGMWTVDAFVQVQKVKIKDGTLTLRTRRLAAFFKDKQLAVTNSPKREVEFVMPLPPDEPGLNRLFDTIFFGKDESYLPSLPKIWMGYFEREASAKQMQGDQKKGAEETPGAQSPYRVGGGVKAPHVTYAPDPPYSDVAREANLQGVVVLWTVVGPDARAHDVRLVRPLGMGLDEAAVATVESWKFEPATKDEQPVAVYINIEFNFRLH